MQAPAREHADVSSYPSDSKELEQYTADSEQLCLLLGRLKDRLNRMRNRPVLIGIPGQDVDMSDVFYTHKLFTVSPTPMSI